MSAPASGFKQFPRKEYGKITGTQTGITAYAGGGQANATQLTKKFNDVTTVVSASDSVKLPSALAGRIVYVRNTAANTLAVFPQSGEYMNEIVDGSKSIATGTGMGFVCVKQGYWFRFEIGT